MGSHACVSHAATSPSLSTAARRSRSWAGPFGSSPCSSCRVHCTRTGRPTARENRDSETTASGTASVKQPGSNGLGLLNSGYVETSNVNVVEELVNMIQTQRAYEINSKAIQTSDQMLQKLAQL